jgi:micrococcal nuclease
MSRRSRNLIIAACVFLFAVVVAIDRTRVNRLFSPPAGTQNIPTVSDVDKYHSRSFAVLKVVDGDTLDINVPDINFSYTRIRLWGVDTPETRNPRTGPMYFGAEASEFARGLTLGKTVTIYLETDKNTRDRYGRLLAYVQLPDKTFLNERLLSEGYGYADLRFRHGLYNKYQQLESAARSQKRGLWESIEQDQLPQWLQKRRPDLIRDWH